MIPKPKPEIRSYLLHKDQMFWYNGKVYKSYTDEHLHRSTNILFYYDGNNPKKLHADGDVIPLNEKEFPEYYI